MSTDSNQEIFSSSRGRDSRATDDAVSEPAATNGVRIEHERPASDTEPHIIAPLIVTLSDGTRLTARKWSLRGITDPVLRGHDLAGARLAIPFQGIDVGFSVRLATSTDDTLWTFEDLTGRQREVLGLFYRNLMNGRMVATDEVITALDTPVDLIPMGETEEEQAAGLKTAKPRALRIVWNILYYVGLFGVVFGYLGSLAWQRLDHVPLSNARYTAPFVEIAAPTAAFVSEIMHSDGASVSAGDLLIEMSDPDTGAGLAEVRGLIAQAEVRLSAAEARLANHMRGEASARASAADTGLFDTGISVRAGDFHDIRQRLEQEARLIELELRALRSERGRLRDAERALEIRAPFDGRIERSLVPPGGFHRAGAPLVIFEQDAPRQIIGWLDSGEAAHVWTGMEASVRYAAEGETRTVSAIVASVEAGTDPLRPDGHGLLIRLDMAGIDLARTRTLLPHNAAVEVRLNRDLARRWFGIGD